MRRISLAFLIGFALISATIVMSPIDVPAYPRYRQSGAADCQDCHGGFVSRGPLHDLHVGTNRMTNNCLLCHITQGDIPFTYQSGEVGGQGCRGCHGVNNGTTFNWGAGLRRHHLMAGAPPDNDGFTCDECHSDPAPSPEPTKPVYYTRADVNVKNPCSVSPPNGEDWDGDLRGLDNDGDLLYDGNDPQCAAVGIGVGPTPGTDVSAAVSISPNPLPPVGGHIILQLPAASTAKVGIYDLTGRLVLTRTYSALPAGRHSLLFRAIDENGGRLKSGTYVVLLEAEGMRASAKFTLLR